MRGEVTVGIVMVCGIVSIGMCVQVDWSATSCDTWELLH